MSVFSFVGSRSLSVSFKKEVSAAVSAVVSGGCSVSVGCCVGADSFVLSSCLSGVVPLSAVHCFAAFDSDGVGGCSLSARDVVLTFRSAGGQVSWLAGGDLSVPLSSRLFFRSRSVVESSAGCVVFFSDAFSIGSRSSAAFAASLGLPVFAFACGFSPCFLPPLSKKGFWSASAVYGIPCFKWVLSNVQDSLF